MWSVCRGLGAGDELPGGLGCRWERSGMRAGEAHGGSCGPRGSECHVVDAGPPWATRLVSASHGSRWRRSEAGGGDRPVQGCDSRRVCQGGSHRALGEAVSGWRPGGGVSEGRNDVSDGTQPTEGGVWSLAEGRPQFQPRTVASAVPSPRRWLRQPCTPSTCPGPLPMGGTVQTAGCSAPQLLSPVPL